MFRRMKGETPEKKWSNDPTDKDEQERDGHDDQQAVPADLQVLPYGINVADVQQVIQTAIAGTEATRILEGFRRFDLVIRLKPGPAKQVFSRATEQGKVRK